MKANIGKVFRISTNVQNHRLTPLVPKPSIGHNSEPDPSL